MSDRPIPPAVAAPEVTPVSHQPRHYLRPQADRVAVLQCRSLGVLRSAGWIRTSRMSVEVLDLPALRLRAGLY